MNDDRALGVDRDRLARIAFRLLGTVADAEDAVQEALTRWYGLPRSSRDVIENAEAWLTTVLTRICLDVLGSAARRREEYVGPWLPEPLPANSVREAGDPSERAEVSDLVGIAVLRIMEQMTPAERTAFVLHDVFGYSFAEIGEMLDRSAGAARQLASSGRRRLRDERSTPVEKRVHSEILEAFLDACDSGDLEKLTALLDPTVVLTSDGGGLARAALNPIIGLDKVGRFMLGVRDRRPEVHLELGTSEGGAAILFVEANGVSGVLNLHVSGGLVDEVWIQWNPRKLTRWNPRLTFHEAASSTE